MDANRVCELHKRIMKNDVNAIDEIETLEEAKEIIAMMACFNATFNILERIKEDF